MYHSSLGWLGATVGPEGTTCVYLCTEPSKGCEAVYVIEVYSYSDGSVGEGRNALFLTGDRCLFFSPSECVNSMFTEFMALFSICKLYFLFVIPFFETIKSS